MTKKLTKETLLKKLEQNIIAAPNLDRLLRNEPLQEKLEQNIIAAPNLDRLLRNIPEGRWAAISQNQERVVATGKDLIKVLERAKKKGENTPFVAKALRKNLILGQRVN
jgi:hypothetical protein